MFIKITQQDECKTRVNIDKIIKYTKTVDGTIICFVNSHDNIIVKETVEQIDQALAEAYITIKEVG